MEHLKPKNHGEEVAVFRHGLIGELAVRELDHGERSEALRRLSEQRVRGPGSDTTRCYSIATLERWLYAFKKGGLEALAPRARGDRGRGRDLEPELRELLCDIRREHPSVSVKVILRTLRADGRVGPEVTACTVRRMFAERGLTRTAAADGDGSKTRLRWQAECPGALWHGDVCHGPTLTLDGKRTPVRVHGLLDDASRYGINLRVYEDEREERMLSVFGQSLLEHGKPSALYLDNGATYRGETLQLVCSRLGITLLHARPTMRQRAARWSASGGECARRPCRTSGRSLLSRKSSSSCATGSRATTKERRTPAFLVAHPLLDTPKVKRCE